MAFLIGFIFIRRKSELPRHVFCDIIMFGMIIMLKSVFVAFKYFYLSDKGASEIDMCDCKNRAHNNEFVIELIFFMRFVDSIFDFFMILIFYNYIHGMYNFWDELFKENVFNEMEVEGNDEKYNELLVEYHYADA